AHFVRRDRKLAAPAAPNRLPAEPPPKAEPMSDPLPCCNSTSTMMVSADSTCKTSRPVRTKDISCSRFQCQTASGIRIAGRTGCYSVFSHLRSGCVCGPGNAREIRGIQRGAAHQAAVDVGHGKEALRIGCL